MSKKTKEIINYGAIAAMFLIFLVPILLVNYSKLENNKKFHEWLREDTETCHQRAERDAVDTRWCNEIRDAASLAYILYQVPMMVCTHAADMLLQKK